jgi:hypothetical protein
MKNAVFWDFTPCEPHVITSQKTPFFNNCIHYLYRAFNNPFPNIIFNHTTINEIEKVIKSLKTKNS